MKNVLTTILGILVATLVLANNGENKLTVIIKNVSSTNGVVSVSLFSSEEDWLSEGQTKKIKIDNEDAVIIEFENVPVGEYAISVIHDENENGDLDTNFMGIPSEPYGFSNDARGMFEPATFADSKFKVEGDKKIEITVK